MGHELKMSVWEWIDFVPVEASMVMSDWQTAYDHIAPRETKSSAGWTFSAEHEAAESCA